MDRLTKYRYQRSGEAEHESGKHWWIYIEYFQFPIRTRNLFNFMIFFLGNSGKVWTSPWEMYSLINTTRHAILNYSPLRSRDIVKRTVKGRLTLCFVGINQWRIQDFPGGRGRQLPKWNFFAHFFAEKMKEFRPRGRPWRPPGGHCQRKHGRKV